MNIKPNDTLMKCNKYLIYKNPGLHISSSKIYCNDMSFDMPYVFTFNIYRYISLISTQKYKNIFSALHTVINIQKGHAMIYV